MTLSRIAVALLVFSVSTGAWAADPNSTAAVSSDTSKSTVTIMPRLVPWFAGTKRQTLDADPDLTYNAMVGSLHAPSRRLNGNLMGATCLKLRAYKVKGKETLSENESAFVSYSSCQWATNYQIRSAVQSVQEPAR